MTHHLGTDRMSPPMGFEQKIVIQSASSLSHKCFLEFEDNIDYPKPSDTQEECCNYSKI